MSKAKVTKTESVDNSLCFYCGEKLTEGYWIIPIDTPYVNIYIHQSCKGKYYSERKTFLKENQTRISEYAEKYGLHGIEPPKLAKAKAKGKTKKKSKKQEKSKK